MKRVVKIVLLISFLVAVFIFSSPWLLFWAMPITEPFSDFEAKFYVYDVKKGTKTLLYSYKGLRDAYPLYIDDKNNRVFFLKPQRLDYIIPSLHIDAHRVAGTIAVIDLNTKSVRKFWKFFADKEFSLPCCYSPFMNGRFHFVRTKGDQRSLIRLNENGKEEQVTRFPFKYDPNGDMLVPVGDDSFLFSKIEGRGENAVTTVARIKNDKMDVLARHTGQGGLLWGLLYGFDSPESKGGRESIEYVVKQCLKFPSTGCKLYHYAYNMRTGKINETVKIILPDNKIFWFAGVKDEHEIALVEYEKKHHVYFPTMF